MPQRSLPDYENPPAQETWMSFRFTPLKWDIPHFGAFWNEIRTDYPKFEVHPPLGEFKVEFDAMSPEAVMRFPVRCWFISEQDNRLIQVQNTRFFHNWRRPSVSEKYLHYDELKPHFEKEWNRFCSFTANHGIGIPNVFLGEVSYINHLEQGLGWERFSDLAAVFPTIGPLTGRDFLKEPETASINVTYVMPVRDGRLQLNIQPGIRQSDGKEILQFTLTASCPPLSNRSADLFGCLDACRAWVVQAFDDFTSAHMHEIWRKI